MEYLHFSVSLGFACVVLLTIGWFYAASKSKLFLGLAIVWSIIQSILAYSGVYQNTEVMPPLIMVFGILPTIVFMLIAFFTKKGKAFINQVNIETLTYFHSIRIPVEIILSVLFHYGVMSELATFEGTNFDILSGLSAPIIAYMCFKNRNARLNFKRKKLLLIWNIVGLLLLLNVMITAVFAFPSPFQQFAFNQPNIAPLHFPFTLLPTVVVPLVIFAHILTIKRLIVTQKKR